MKRVAAFVVATLLLGAATAASQTLAPPGPRTPRDSQRSAVALEPGTLHRFADVGSEKIIDFQRGHIFEYLGEATDTFAREWYSVGNGDGWLRTENWYTLPAEIGTPPEGGTVSLLTSLPAPQASPAEGFASSAAAVAYVGAQQLAIEVASDWWDQTLEIDAAALGRTGRVVGVPATRIPDDVAQEMEALLGGIDVAGPLPVDAGFGRLFVAPRTGLVYRFDGGAWRLTQPVLAVQSMVGLLANPTLLVDTDVPGEATGRPLACWRLVGGLDPRGQVAGNIGRPPAPPLRLQASARPAGDRYLGYYNLTERAWPVTGPEMFAPRRVLPAQPGGGVLLADSNRRQAVYLEQVIPAAITQQLRGREMRAQLMARAPADGDGGTATAALEVEAGSVRLAVSAQVGSLPTPVTLNFAVPEDAETITVRVLPVDLSIAVIERGAAVIDSATLVPADWPAAFQAAPLLLRNLRTVSYRPAPRFTRARLVVTERPVDEVVTIWREIANDPDDTIARILAAEVQVGMTERQVELAWGAPEQVVDTGLKRWLWSDRAATFAATGELLAWTLQPEREPERASICGWRPPAAEVVVE